MDVKGPGVSKNPTLEPGFLKNYTSEFLENFFLNRPKWAFLVVKILAFPFQNCRRKSSFKLAQISVFFKKFLWGDPR
jgi:hypothetical protein